MFILMCLGATHFSSGLKAAPAILLSANNQTPKCATSRKLLSFLRIGNPLLHPKFEPISVLYEKYGKQYKIRWDFAFFQMILETNYLKFTGDVHLSQNNFAGLGATGMGASGERFNTVSDGVRAHLEHLLVYAGVYVNDPVANRTRKIQSWKILDDWRRSITGPVTFGDIGLKWAPYSRNYTNSIVSISNRYYQAYCRNSKANAR